MINSTLKNFLINKFKKQIEIQCKEKNIVPYKLVLVLNYEDLDVLQLVIINNNNEKLVINLDLIK